MNAVAECSSLPAACANNSSNHVATLPLSVAIEQRIAVADNRTTFSDVNPNGTVFGWCIVF